MDENSATGGGQPTTPEFNESNLPKFSEIDVENATPEQVAELVKAGQTLLGLTKHYRKKAEEAPARSKETTPASTPTPTAATTPGAGDDELRRDVDRLKLSEEKRQFGHSHSLTPEETDHLFAFATGMNLKPTEAMQHPFFKSGLSAMRQEAKNGDAIPGPSRRAPIVEGKTFGEMTNDERAKNFDKVIAGLRKK